MIDHTRPLWSPDRADPPPGMIEYETRSAIRDLVRLLGYEEARNLITGYLNEEADRRKQ